MSGPRCPCCGGTMPAGPAPREQLAGLIAAGDANHRILRRLARRPGHWVLEAELVDVAFGHREDGGPLTAQDGIRGLLRAMEGRLWAYGWMIERRWAAYRLVLAHHPP